MSVAFNAQNVWLHSKIRHGPLKAYRLATAEKLSNLQKAWHRQRVKVKGLVQASQHQQLTTSDPATASSSDSDTIAAVVTGAQQGSVAIIRLSGPDAVQIASSVFVPSSSKKAWMPKTHRVYHGHVLDTEGGVVDEVLLLSMLAPKSYTSEDVIELHCHGGGVCVQRVLGCCLREGARLAKPGEFTLRAFLNGRLDLSQAESVNELVGARTAAAADSALAGLTGGIGATVQRLRLSALTLLAELEAMIDFEEDVPVTDAQRLQKHVQDMSSGVKEALDTASKGRLLKAGLQVALVGRPNVGKSSLLNAWSGTDKAIVTQVAGTTRDIVQADVVVAGVPVSLLDTAGIREASDVVERLGVERSRAAAMSADIAVMVLDAQVGWTPDDQVIFDHLWGRAVPGNKPAIAAPLILVWNKVDLVAPAASELQFQSPLHTAFPPEPRLGLDALNAALLQLSDAPSLAAGGVSWAVNSRQAEALIRAQEALLAVTDSISEGLPIDFWTIDLRSAVAALGEVSGDDVTEEVLDSVFSRFCIGK
ncbi:hypothetical protein WJX79_003589 [Trebouxia sp. C0005]